MIPDYEVTQNDIPGTLIVTLYDATGAVVNLSAAATIVFHMERLDQTTVIAAGATSVTDASGGKVSYTWAAADTVKAEFRMGQFKVTFADGRIVSFPTDPKMLIRVAPAVA
jgi:hypothetical protein